MPTPRKPRKPRKNNPQTVTKTKRLPDGTLVNVTVYNSRKGASK